MFEKGIGVRKPFLKTNDNDSLHANVEINRESIYISVRVQLGYYLSRIRQVRLTIKKNHQDFK